MNTDVLPIKPDFIALNGTIEFTSKTDPKFYTHNLETITHYMTLVSDYLAPVVGPDHVTLEPAKPIIKLDKTWHKTIKNYFETSSDGAEGNLRDTYASHKLIQLMREDDATLTITYNLMNYTRYEFESGTVTLKPATKNACFVQKSYKTTMHLYDEYSILKYSNVTNATGVIIRGINNYQLARGEVMDEIVKPIIKLQRNQSIVHQNPTKMFNLITDYLNHNAHYKGGLIKTNRYDTIKNLKHWYLTELYKIFDLPDEITKHYKSWAWECQDGGTDYAYKACTYYDLRNTYRVHKNIADELLTHFERK